MVRWWVDEIWVELLCVYVDSCELLMLFICREEQDYTICLPQDIVFLLLSDEPTQELN